MTSRTRYIIGGSIAVIAVSLFFLMFAAKAESSPTIDEIVSDVVVKRAAEIAGTDSEVPFGEEGEVHVLLMGLDARASEVNPHCDALHMFSLDTTEWTITITSVPRGTYAYIPEVYDPAELYIANACSHEGVDYGVTQVENIVGVQADYVVTVGFSQAMGIFRLFDLPASETLQWLRHRQGYGIGEPQRIHNQAIFMKDLIIDHIDQFSSGAMLPVEYILYSFIETDMPFDVLSALLHAFVDAEMSNRPDDITLQMRPHYETVDIHYDAETVEGQLEALYEYIGPLLSEEDFTGDSDEDVQERLVGLLESILQEGDLDVAVYEQKLWLQLENQYERERIQYAFLAKYLEGVEGEDDQIQLISDYILEKQALGAEEWEEKGRELLADVLDQV